jgi:hypothetical protein
VRRGLVGLCGDETHRRWFAPSRALYTNLYFAVKRRLLRRMPAVPGKSAGRRQEQPRGSIHRSIGLPLLRARPCREPNKNSHSSDCGSWRSRCRWNMHNPLRLGSFGERRPTMGSTLPEWTNRGGGAPAPPSAQGAGAWPSGSGDAQLPQFQGQQTVLTGDEGSRTFCGASAEGKTQETEPDVLRRRLLPRTTRSQSLGA